MEIYIKGLTKAYGERELFGDVNVHIGTGERCALVGRNGSGKSTLIKILAGQEAYDAGEIATPKGCRIGTLAQHQKFTQKTLVDEAALGLQEDVCYETYRVERLLSGLGFTKEDFEAPPESFSGGYQLRLALTKVLAGEPNLLLLDEPTNYLDIVSIRWLEQFLKNWEGQMIFVSHDRSFVNAVCTHVLGIKRSQIFKNKGSLQDYEEQLLVKEETHENRRLNLEKKKAHMQAFVDRFGAKATKAAQAQSRMKALSKMETLDALQEENTLDFSFTYKPIVSKHLMKVDAISFAYDPQEPLIEKTSLELNRQERLAIIGKNGRGKSTLLRLLLGELQPQSGSIQRNGSLSVAYFGQTHIDRLDSSLTIEGALMEAFPDVPYGRIRAACGAMLFSGDDAKKPISVLSGGERSRVLLAQILLTPANLLLLDEPTHHLDMESVQALMSAIQRFEGAVILVTHDESVLEALKPEKLVVCRQSQQRVFWGDYSAFLQSGGWDEASKVSSATTPNRSRQNRKERALQVQERSRKLRPIRQKLQSTEADIQALEARIQDIEQQLHNPSGLDHATLYDLSHEHGQASQRLEHLYADLDALGAQETEILEAYPS